MPIKYRMPISADSPTVTSEKSFNLRHPCFFFAPCRRTEFQISSKIDVISTVPLRGSGQILSVRKKRHRVRVTNIDVKRTIEVPVSKADWRGFINFLSGALSSYHSSVGTWSRDGSWCVCRSEDTFFIHQKELELAVSLRKKMQLA